MACFLQFCRLDLISTSRSYVNFHVGPDIKTFFYKFIPTCLWISFSCEKTEIASQDYSSYDSFPVEMRFYVINSLLFFYTDMWITKKVVFLFCSVAQGPRHGFQGEGRAKKAEGHSWGFIAFLNKFTTLKRWF